MDKPTVYDMSMLTAFAKEITFHIWTHHRSTGAEVCNHDKRIKANGDDMMPYEYNDVDLIMVEALKKNCFAIYGIRHVD